jgi:hypothetical protein
LGFGFHVDDASQSESSVQATVQCFEELDVVVNAQVPEQQSASDVQLS